MNFRKIIKKFVPSGLFRTIEPYGHTAEAMMINAINGFPARGFKVIGVTGTNGKTTTSFMIHRMLHEAGYKVGLMSTVAWGVGDNIHPQMQHYTNVPVPELMQRLKAMRKEGAEWLVVETTSQALAQGRTWGIPYSLAVLTNLTHDHLTYHGTFERYRDAKRKMFKLANRNGQGFRTGIINADDPNAEFFASDIQKPLMYGINKGEIQATNVKTSPSGVKYTLTHGDNSYEIVCRLPGSFNVYNSLAAASVGITLGLNKQQIEQGIAALEGVAGRMSRVDEGQDFDVIVDYAHSPDSYDKLFRDIKPVVKGKLIVLFGSLGGGDKAKRPAQGKLAGEFADLVILTEEDNRTEDPDQILNDIAVGVESTGKTRDKDLILIHDRTEAINYAMKHASTGDTVLLLGKGHEATIESAYGEHPWDEIATARQALSSR